MKVNICVGKEDFENFKWITKRHKGSYYAQEKRDYYDVDITLKGILEYSWYLLALGRYRLHIISIKVYE